MLNMLKSLKICNVKKRLKRLERICFDERLERLCLKRLKRLERICLKRLKRIKMLEINFNNERIKRLCFEMLCLKRSFDERLGFERLGFERIGFMRLERNFDDDMFKKLCLKRSFDDDMFKKLCLKRSFDERIKRLERLGFERLMRLERNFDDMLKKLHGCVTHQVDLMVVIENGTAQLCIV